VSGERNAPVWVTWLLVLAAVVLVVIGIVYFVEPAKSLPSFFPGHDAAVTRHHVKHGIAAVVVAGICLAIAWISSGTRRSTT
jgi:amino acid permease